MSSRSALPSPVPPHPLVPLWKMIAPPLPLFLVAPFRLRGSTDAILTGFNTARLPCRGPCFCHGLPPSQLFFCSLSFCQADHKLEAVYPAPRDDCGGGSSLSGGGLPSPAPCTTVPTMVQVSSQVAHSPSPALPHWQCQFRPWRGCGAGLCLLNFWGFSLLTPARISPQVGALG